VQGDASTTILVVEDDETVRRFCLNVLRKSGYKTLEAFDGRDGLTAFLRHRSEIDMVLTDILMPGMMGIELVENIHRWSRSTRVVLMSGTAGFSRLPPSLRDLPVLEKPFTAEKLIDCIRTALGRAAV
jgi:DNA-binding NtrC family response regulator